MVRLDSLVGELYGLVYTCDIMALLDKEKIRFCLYVIISMIFFSLHVVMLLLYHVCIIIIHITNIIIRHRKVNSAHTTGAYPSFRSMMQLGILLLLLDGMLVHHRLGYPQHFVRFP